MRISKKLLVTGTAAIAVVAGGGAAYAAIADPIFTPDTKITAEQAIKTAQAKVPGAQLVGLDFDNDKDDDDNGAAATGPVWQVELRDKSTEHEIDVNAQTGAIVQQSNDQTDADDDD